MNKHLEKIGTSYVAWIYRNAGKVFVAGLVLTLLAGISAARFTLKTDFAELLPQNEPSVVELERARGRLGGLSNLIVVVMGESPEINRKVIDDLADKLKEISNDYVVYMKYNIKEEKKFYEEHQHLFVDLEDLKELHRRLQEKIRYERIKNNPVLALDFDGEQLEPVEFNIDDLKSKYEKKTSDYNRYIDDYLNTEKGRLWAILLYPPGSSTSVDFGKRLLAVVREKVAQVCIGDFDRNLPPQKLDKLIQEGCRRRYHPSLEIGFTGTVLTAIEEQSAIVDDIVLVTTICLILVLVVIFLYFRSLRSIPVISVPLLMGTVWTFGISYYIVGHLNNSTAFLASIIVGNGINFGLIQLARYFEERNSGQDILSALTKAVLFTAQSTSTAALAASIAYGSLIITKFRGFNGFGYMGGMGMILCWISAFSVQPALVVLLEKIKPWKTRTPKGSWSFGFLSRFYQRLIAVHTNYIHFFMLLFTAACILFTINYLKDPYEYDFRNLRNQTSRLSGAGALSSRVDGIFTRRLTPMFVLADRKDQVPLIVEQLKLQNSTGRFRGIFQDIVSIYSFLPGQQEEKIRVLKKIRKLLTESTLSWLEPEQREKVLKYRPPEDIRPIELKDLPFSLTRMFTELDGKIGLVVAMYPRHGVSVWDGRFLIELAEVSKEIRLPDGEKVLSSGSHTIFADMIRAIERDGPLAVSVSLLGVVLLILLVYSSLKFVILILVSLIYGVLWTVGPAAFIDLKLNFLNFIALPITFGIGIDYAVNILNRYRLEGPGSISKVITNTGGAVFLCSLTTIIGYSSLLTADNRALVTFGLLADIGEFASLLAAILFIPAAITSWENHALRRRAGKKVVNN